MSEATPFGIYLHIPYCKAKCRYCDFYSAPGARGVPQSYVDALLRELAKNTRRPDTLYFGGGTPALLVPAQAAALIEAANPLPGAEITLEANPDVVTPETLRGFRAAGVTRISFGVQSADDAQLRRLGRTHTAAGAAQALAWAREAGFPEICGDIMLALPEYTNAEFDRTLALLRDGGCTHISAYLLKVEPGTAFYRNPAPAGHLPPGGGFAYINSSNIAFCTTIPAGVRRNTSPFHTAYPCPTHCRIKTRCAAVNRPPRRSYAGMFSPLTSRSCINR